MTASATALLERRSREARGRVGVLILDAAGVERFALDADSVFPAASVIKLPLAMTLFADAAEGRLDLGGAVDVGARVDGSGVLRDLRDVGRMTLRDLAALALTVSDNTAANRLIERVGAARVNARLEEWGCASTRLRRAMFDLEAKARGLENSMTPRETASLLARVRDGAAAGDGAMSAVLALLARNTSLLRLGRYLPEGVRLAHKDGWMEGVENDAGIVTARESAVVAAFTAGVHPAAARPLLGLAGLAAAEVGSADGLALPREALAGA